MRNKDRIKTLCKVALERCRSAATVEQLRDATAVTVLESVDAGRQLEQLRQVDAHALYSRVLEYAEAQRLENDRLRSRIVEMHCEFIQRQERARQGR